MNIWSEPLFVQFAFVCLGLILGSFTTMLVYRLYHNEGGIITGRSKCPDCGVKLRWTNLIPVLSWVVQRGMCKKCGKKISPFYPLVELSFALCSLLVVKLMWGESGFWWLWIIVCFALVLFWYDVWFMTVDRRVSIPAIVLVLVYAVWRSALAGEQVGGLGFSVFQSFSFSSFFPYIQGGLLCGGIYFVQYFYSKGRWVGQGDIDLGIFLGLCLGVKLGLLSLFVAYMLGTIFALSLILVHKGTSTRDDWKKIKVPMGAFLMPSLIVFLLWGEEIWSWYWGTFIL